MASYYEFTEGEVEILLGALEYFGINHGTYAGETQKYWDLKHYLETGQRRESQNEHLQRSEGSPG